MWKGKCPMTIENVLDAQNIAGIDHTIVSYPYHELREFDVKQQLDAISSHNRYLASLAQKHKSIDVLACAVPHAGEPFLREFERAVKQDGCKGAMIMSSLPGHYPDDDDAFPFFQLAVELDVPVFVHPPSIGFGEERLNIYRLGSSVGRPMDGAIAISRMIVRGLFEKLPKLKLVGSHLGGGICEMIGRMDYAYNLGDEAYFLGSYEPMMIKHPPSHYLKMMYLEFDLLPRPCCALRYGNCGCRSFYFRYRCPAAQIAQSCGRRCHQSAKAFVGR